MLLHIAEAFAEAAREILLTEANLEVERGALTLSREPFTTEAVTILIGLAGDLTGSVLLSLSQPAALELAGRMLGEPVETLTPLGQSALGELGNVLAGRALIKLSRDGCHASLTPPMLLLGPGTTLSTLDLPRLAMPLRGEGGRLDLRLHLAVRELASPPGPLS